MATRRRKRRTHLKAEDNPNVAKIPKSFVIKAGALTGFASQLVADVRKVMEPNTATRLRERRRNKLKDFVAIAGPMGVSHFLLFSQTDSTTNFRIARFPQGPTLYFRVLSFSLMREILKLQKKPKSTTMEYLTAPLLVLNNIPMQTPQGKLLCSMLQNMFPTIDTSRVELSKIRRVVLFHYDREAETLEFRHYIINIKLIGLSKSIKRIIHSEIPDLSNFADAAEFVLKAEANLSDSEVEPDSVVTFNQEDNSGKKNKKTHQQSVNLIESGPRMTLRLIKVTDGLNAGKVLYHVPDEPETKDDSDQDMNDGPDDDDNDNDDEKDIE